MNRRTWKKEEQTVAEALGTSRALNTDGKADILHDIFLVDAKLRANWSSAGAWFAELSSEAEKKGKIPVLTLRYPRKQQRLAVMDWDNFVSLTKAAGWGPEGKLPELNIKLEPMNVGLPELEFELQETHSGSTLSGDQQVTNGSPEKT
jgi:hypothetical protein